MEAAFQQAWSCKEAFVKARGDGLGFEPLSRIHVDVLAGGAAAPHGCDGSGAPAAGPAGGGGGAGGGGAPLIAMLTVDGAPKPRWRIVLHRLPRRHWAAVALAPPEDVVDVFGVRWYAGCLGPAASHYACAFGRWEVHAWLCACAP